MATTSIGAPGVTFPDATVQTTAAASADVVTRIYISPAAWTKPATLKAVRVTVVGGGGGGAGGRPSSGGAGGPGGNGGILFGYAQASAIPAPLTVTVGPAGTAGGINANGGAGGTSSFGALFSTTGGGGGVTGGGAAGSDGGSYTVTPAATISSVGFTNPRSSPTQAFGVGGGQGGSPAGVGGGGSGRGSSGGGGGTGPVQGGAGGAGTTGIIIVEEFY